VLEGRTACYAGASFAILRLSSSRLELLDLHLVSPQVVARAVGLLFRCRSDATHIGGTTRRAENSARI